LVVVSEEGQPFDGNYGGNGLRNLNEAERHLIKHRELYLTRQIETFKIDMVRYVHMFLLTLAIFDSPIYQRKVLCAVVK